jgi:hypothetical protein
MDASVVLESRPWLAPPQDASILGDAGLRWAGDDAGPGGGPSPVGGLWVSCYGGFHPTREPLKDVTRLGLLCGPPNGMAQLGTETTTGTVAEGKSPLSYGFPARRGSCYRLFAVADPGVTDLNVTVRSSRGTELARDHSEDRWPILEPERPFCTYEDDSFTVELAAAHGAGAVAAQVWVLAGGPPPERRDSGAGD